MINDFKKDHYYSIFEELPLIKNISYEMDTGNYILLDNKGNNYICDIFGRQQPIFKKNISGFINGEQRKVLKRIKSHSSILHPNNSENNTDNTKEESKAYFPSINKFEGYTHFPRPLCPPFSNIPEYMLNENYKRLLINKFEQNINVKENKNIFLKPNENNGLSYLTSNVKGYIDKENENNTNNQSNDIKKKDYKNFLIQMIDNTVNDYKIKYRMGLNELIKNHSIIRAILHLKKNLINNSETNLINGRKLKAPNINIIKYYKIIYNKIDNYTEQKKIKDEHKRLIKCYSQMNMKNYIKINNDENKENKNMFGRKLLKKLNINKSTNNILNDKAFTIKNDNESKISKYLLMNLNKNIKNIKTNISNDNENNNDNNNLNSKTNDNNVNQNIYEEQETKESNGTKGYNNLFNFIYNTNESDKEDNLSILSLMNEKDNNKFIKFNKKIRYLKSLKKDSEKEKKHLEGYQKDEPKKPKVYNVNDEEGPIYRDFGEIYKKEQETLEKLNPILYNLQKKKDDNDLKKLIQKKEFKKLSEKIIMKGRKLKINKSSTDK